MTKTLSCFVDESGDRGGKARYYLLTLVLHNQADSISEKIACYEDAIVASRFWTQKDDFDSETL